MLAKNHFQIKKKENDNNYSGNILSSSPAEEKVFSPLSQNSNFQIAIDISIDIFNIFFTLNKRLSIKK